MRYDIILAGVGGQGVLSMAAIIGHAAAAEGLCVKQSEVHGMSQRGGAVVSHLRLADAPIESDLVAKGTAHLILSLEPVESLRYLPYLATTGTLVTATNPFQNIPNYPDLDHVLTQAAALPRAVLVDAEKLAREAGSVQAVNTVMVGAASHVLPVKPETLEKVVRSTFARKGEDVVRANLAAFQAGREAGATARA